MHRDLFMNCWHIAARQQHFADNATTFPAVCPVGNVFTACLTVFSRPRSDYVCEREWMCTNAAEGRRCCSWVLYAVSANGRCCFLFCTESDRCASSHDLSDTKPWKCSIRMQLFETQIPLFCSVDGLWRCSESFVLPSSAWLSLPPPLRPLMLSSLMCMLIEGYRHDWQSSLSSQYDHVFSSSDKNLSTWVPVIAYHCLQSVSVSSDVICGTGALI